MIVLFVVILFVLFYLRVYFYEVAFGKGALNIAISLFKRIYSFKYFLPISYSSQDAIKVYTYKRYANYALYGFYLMFILIIISAILEKS